MKPSAYSRAPHSTQAEILQTLKRLEDQLRCRYGDRWTLLIETPDFAVLPTVTGPPRWRPRTGSREETKPRRTQTGKNRPRTQRGGRS